MLHKTSSYCFIENFSNELALVLLYVYDSWGKLVTMNANSSIISLIHKKGNKKDGWLLQTTDPCTKILKNRLQNTDTIIG